MDSAVQNHKISHQPIEFANYVLSGIQQVFTESLLTILAIVAIILFNAKLFLLLVLFLLPAILLAALLIRRRLRAVRADVKRNAELVIQYLQEALSGFIESMIYRRSLFFTDRYHRNQQKLNRHLADLQIAQWVPSRLVEFFAVCGLFVLVIANRYYGTLIDTISIGAFIGAVYKIIPGISRIINLSSQIRTYSYTIDTLSQNSVGLHNDGSPHLPAINSIIFRDVSFKYGTKSILTSQTFEIKKGDFVNLVGISGKGKTTLLNLLLGFLSQDSGDILINNEHTTDIERRRWQDRIGYVKQQTFLIHDTISRNITLTEEAVDPKRLECAIEAAGLRTLIQNLDGGADHIIADNGRNISGGQRQRIALARTLYKESDVIILDEPFNELDIDAERQLLDHFRQLANGGRIIILVSHSPNSAEYCNKTISISE